MKNSLHNEYYVLAKKSIEKKDFEQAKVNLLKCLDLKHSFETLNLLGIVNIHLKDFEESIKNFKSLLKNYPSNDSIHNNLGIALKK